MTWFRIDDTWGSHPKVIEAGLRGRMLWLYGGLHCAQHLTDGIIRKSVLKQLAAAAEVPATTAAVLVQVGLWTDEGDHYRMNDYLDYQPSREQVEKERERWAKSKRKSRESRKESTVDSREESTPSRPDPTRPDPTSSCVSGSPPPTTSASALVVKGVIRLWAESQMALELDRRLIENEPSYYRGIHDRLTAEKTEQVTALAADHPDDTAEQLWDRIANAYEETA